MGQVTRGYAAAATALLLLSGASSFGKYISELGRHVAVRLSLKGGRVVSSKKNECYYEKLLEDNAFILRRYDRNIVCSQIALTESTYLMQQICSDTHQYPKNK